jgi:hypothetical protein
MLFQISNGDAGFTLNLQKYDFKDVDNITYTFSKKNNLTRGASGTNRIGIPIKEGLKDPDMCDIKIVDCSVVVYNLLLSCFENQTRINVFFIDKKTGEGYTFKNSVITDKPRQGEIAEGIDAIHFMLKVKSFDVREKIKDE